MSANTRQTAQYPSSLPSSLPLALNDATHSRRIWLASLLLALLLHSIPLWLGAPWRVAPSTPRVDIKPIDPTQLEQIRKQWKEKEKQLLLDKDKSRGEQEAPKDARYFSDKNTKVDKEQRANVTNVIPKAGGIPKPGENQADKAKESSKQTKLSDLGVKMDLNRVAEKPISEASQEKVPEGGDQALSDKSLPEGGENLLNTEQSVYYSFYSRLYHAIGPIWQSRIRNAELARPLPPGDYITVVDVIFDSDGNLVEVKYLKNSGVDHFDTAVESSWRKILRFPNPPRALLDRDGQVHTAWNFTVSVGPGTGIEYLPPKRVN